MRRVGQEIGADLQKEGIDGVLAGRHVRNLQSQRRCD